MRLVLQYQDESEENRMVLKIALPKKWEAGPMRQVVETFVEAYNKKHADAPLAVDSVVVKKANGDEVPPDGPVQDFLAHRDEVVLSRGTPKLLEELRREAPPAVPASALRCRNPGCNATFQEHENHAEACRYHLGPPVFHDTRKWWGCCPDKRAYDWDEFVQIPGCQVGQHSTAPRSVEFAKSPTVAAAEAAAAAAAASAAAAPAVQIKSIDSYNAANADAVTAVSAMMRKPKPQEVAADGTAMCRNNGCQQRFKVDENHEGACNHHEGKPVFHDRVKIWSCCPANKAYEWEEFMQIPGCKVGPHSLE